MLKRVLAGEFDQYNEDDLNEALLRSACHGYEDCLLVLLAHGADADCEDLDGDTPLMLACSNNHIGQLPPSLPVSVANHHVHCLIVLLILQNVSIQVWRGRPSVCPPHACIVLQRRKLESRNLYRRLREGPGYKQCLKWKKVLGLSNPSSPPCPFSFPPLLHCLVQSSQLEGYNPPAPFPPLPFFISLPFPFSLR